ncbi:MAG: hypothetical protein A3K19_25965 [Lentisphaerae bacterium RIFOXYB12_FULL_65_16]|nr:MAG: hypothetical protein A3K18_06825 [Lentisphaerae bacterium RIFOXYA12_64_32]OGV92616.1 MAG: hypothetical protein A3K19_25965 [Lentisphaerae bacterium RIFOXYB12_FULL_65_16]
MNLPPKEFVRVIPDRLHGFIREMMEKAGMPGDDVRLLADLLVAADLRGVHSHGIAQVPRYANELRRKAINASPQIRILRETETTAVLDGDGGLGYFPAFRAAHLVVEKAKAYGVGIATTRNHGHYGSAGHYSRIASNADCIGISASEVRCMPAPERGCVLNATCYPPVSFAIPAGDQPPIVADMALSFMCVTEDNFADLFSRMPDAFFKLLGLCAVVHSLGAILPGLFNDESGAAGQPRYEDANQGAFIVAIDVSRFLPLDEFKRQVDRFVAAARTMEPFPGCGRAELAGGLEWQREKDYARDGIPVSLQSLAELNAAAAECGVAKLECSKPKPLSSR